MLRFVAADPVGREQKSDDHRVCQSLDTKSLRVSRWVSAARMSQKWETNLERYCGASWEEDGAQTERVS